MHGRPTATPRVARERGFTLVEILVAMTIIAIIMAIAIISFRGAKGTTYAKETIAAGAAYSQAISQFQADHANKLPAGAELIKISNKEAGPANLLNKPYIGSLPEGVDAGRISVSMTCGGAKSGTYGHVAFCPGTAPAYEVQVFTRKDSTKAFPGAPTCTIGNTASTAPRC